MKKIILTAVGFSFTLSILSSNHFIATALNKGDGGAPQRPDLAYTYGDPGVGGGIISNKSVKDPGGGGMVSNEAEGDTPAPAYSHADLPISADGNHGGSPSYGHADTPAPQKPDLTYNIGDTWSPADNRGDGGSPSYTEHGDGGGIINNEEHGDTPSPQV